MKNVQCGQKKDKALKALLNEDNCQTQEGLAGSLEFTQAGIPKCLKARQLGVNGFITTNLNAKNRI